MLIKNLNIIQEFFIWFILFSITFSNAAVEISFGFISLIFIIKFFLNHKIPIIKRLNNLRTPLNIFLFIIFIIYIVSFMRSEFPKDSFKGILRIIKYSLLYFSLYEFFSSDIKRIKRIFWAIIVISGFTFLNGIFQSLSGFDILRQHLIDKTDCLLRINASFVHPNDYGSFIIAMLPLSLLFLLPKLPKNKRIILLIVLILGLFCLIRTSSRGAWLGFIIGLIIFFYSYNKKLAIILPIALIILISVFPNGLNRMSSLFSGAQNSSWERTKLWEGTWNMIKEHPITGFGINTFSDYFPKFKPADYPDARYAHNSYMQMWSEIGIIGLMTFLGLIITALWTTFNKFNKKISCGFEGMLLLSLVSGWTAFLVQAALDTNLYSLVLITLFWFITALIIALNKHLETRI